MQVKSPVMMGYKMLCRLGPTRYRDWAFLDAPDYCCLESTEAFALALGCVCTASRCGGMIGKLSVRVTVPCLSCLYFRMVLHVPRIL